MAKFPNTYFKLESNGKGTGAILKEIHPYELEQTAHWKCCEDEVCYWFECSNCGNNPLYTRYKQEILSDYCPYCGCLMIDEDKGG